MVSIRHAAQAGMDALGDHSRAPLDISGRRSRPTIRCKSARTLGATSGIRFCVFPREYRDRSRLVHDVINSAPRSTCRGESPDDHSSSDAADAQGDNHIAPFDIPRRLSRSTTLRTRPQTPDATTATRCPVSPGKLSTHRCLYAAAEA